MKRVSSLPRIAVPVLAALSACTPVDADRATDTTEASREALLARSIPAAGATVRAPQTLSLSFREPVRLVEVTITGPSGEMPMMVTAAGEQRSYTVPLPDLESGPHEVRWRALDRGGMAHEGRLSFTVR